VEAAVDPEAWGIDVVDDLEIAGWVFVPTGIEPQDHERWIRETASKLGEVVGNEGFEGETVTFEDVRPILQNALDERERAHSVAMFQVWPVQGPAAVYCHVSILSNDGLPDWTEIGAVVHSIEAPHIGPGLQVATRRTIEVEGDPVELASVNLVFDNGEVTLLLTIDESLAPLVAYALPGLLLLMESIRLVRADGVPFVSERQVSLVEDPPWRFEEDQ